MNTIKAQLRFAPLAAAAAVFPLVSAAVEPYPNQTDAFGNTQGGTYSLGAYGSGPGYNNTAFGYFALEDDRTGYNNTAVGLSALAYNDSGAANTAIGVGAIYENRTGSFNTAMGLDALSPNTSGNYNTASGYFALGGTLNGVYSTQASITGSYNTATGSLALQFDTTGSANTASGYQALQNNTTGIDNTASGANALAANSAGNNNTADGFGALQYNGPSYPGAGDDGHDNTALGYQALNFNHTGQYNTASGVHALGSNSGGQYNTASGAFSLNNTTVGGSNTATGVNALYSNQTGNNNVGIGSGALFANVRGNNNIALGYNAGVNTDGSANIDIGNGGVAGESSTIRLGDPTMQNRVFVAGVSNASVIGVPVVVNSSGQLGVVLSSARYKQDIEDMGDKSSALTRLRPVTFRYKTDPAGVPQYGLIAEEVAKVYPDLAVRDGNGEIETVQYLQLVPMLLNELQKALHREDVQAARIQALADDLSQQTERLAKIEADDRARASVAAR